jgi:hypothetical protein
MGFISWIIFHVCSYLHRLIGSSFTVPRLNAIAGCQQYVDRDTSMGRSSRSLDKVKNMNRLKPLNAEH